jgi:ribosome maturation protein Sdo1
VIKDNNFGSIDLSGRKNNNTESSIQNIINHIDNLFKFKINKYKIYDKIITDNNVKNIDDVKNIGNVDYE